MSTVESNYTVECCVALPESYRLCVSCSTRIRIVHKDKDCVISRSTMPNGADATAVTHTLVKGRFGQETDQPQELLLWS